MVYESELIKRDELKVGNIYRKELLDLYAEDYNCMLIIPDSPTNIFTFEKATNYEVKLIIDNCSVVLSYNRSLNQYHCKKVIVIERA